MKKLLFIALFTHTLFGAESLMDALLDGNLTHKITADYKEDESLPLSSSRTQKMLFYYKTSPKEGFRVEVATQSFAKETAESSTDNTLYYTEAGYQGKNELFGYQLHLNYYADTYRQSIAQKSMESSNAVGAKAQMNYERFGSYVAYSKILDGTLSNASNLEGKDHLLPTSSVLSSNNYAPNTQAYAIDLNYALSSEVTIGSRYVIASEFQNTYSYTGIYSSFKVNEIAKGFNIGILYDKTGIDKQNNQFSLQLKSAF